MKATSNKIKNTKTRATVPPSSVVPFPVRLLSHLLSVLLITQPVLPAYAAGVSAADLLAARYGARGMLATDLFTTLRRIVNPDVIDVNHDESSNSAT